MVTSENMHHLLSEYKSNLKTEKQLADGSDDEQECQLHRGRQFAWNMAIIILERLLTHSPLAGPLSSHYLELAGKEMLAYLDDKIEYLEYCREEGRLHSPRTLAKLNVTSTVLADFFTLLAQED